MLPADVQVAVLSVVPEPLRGVWLAAADWAEQPGVVQGCQC